MSSLLDLLPKPKNDVAPKPSPVAPSSLALVPQGGPKAAIPAYGKRRAARFIPRTAADFGDGGAFPEIHVAQYPLDMGRKSSGGKERTLALSVDGEGKVKYDAIARQGHRDGKTVFASPKDLVPIKPGDKVDLERPSEEAVADTTARTAAAIAALTGTKIKNALPVADAANAAASSKQSAQYFKYTASGGLAGSQGKQRVVRMVEAAVDPLEPPKFKHQKSAARPPSPPVPVLQEPAKKLSKEEREMWDIPPCVSQWKNNQRYTVGLDKRLAADGMVQKDVSISDRFAKLSETLMVAERAAREEVELRASIEARMARREKEQQEEKLRALAQEARNERMGLTAVTRAPGGSGVDAAAATDGLLDSLGGGGGGGGGAETAEERAARQRRDAIREERKREREADRRIEASGADKRARTASARDRERDVSERVALGQAVHDSAKTGEVQYDERLFNQDTRKRYDEDDVYDEPLIKPRASDALYRPGRSGMDMDAYVPAGSSGPSAVAGGLSTDADALLAQTRKSGAARTRPVEFEKADPFGLDQHLSEAKKR